VRAAFGGDKVGVGDDALRRHRASGGDEQPRRVARVKAHARTVRAGPPRSIRPRPGDRSVVRGRSEIQEERRSHVDWHEGSSSAREAGRGAAVSPPAEALWAITGSGRDIIAKGFVLLLAGVPIYVLMKWRQAVVARHHAAELDVMAVDY
jgi:hypothetical protein